MNVDGLRAWLRVCLCFSGRLTPLTSVGSGGGSRDGRVEKRCVAYERKEARVAGRAALVVSNQLLGSRGVRVNGRVPEDSSWSFSLDVPAAESCAAKVRMGGAHCSSLAVWVRWIVGRIKS